MTSARVDFGQALRDYRRGAALAHGYPVEHVGHLHGPLLVRHDEDLRVGGERSLAALAFLFAIFRARPSPFYLMDEVEAALDDVNLHRFLEVVRGFAASSQILVVTHQKRTMEMADVLYGVSMGQGGASRVISQRLVGVAAG